MAYDQRREAGVEQDALECANRSTALLCLGELNEALDGFREANRLAAERLPGKTQPYLDKIGTILWLLEKRGEAINTFRLAIDGIINGSIEFTDNSGGISECLLLWYAAITVNDAEQKAHAERSIRKLAKKSRIKEWPGTIGLFALGQKSREDVLSDCVARPT